MPTNPISRHMPGCQRRSTTSLHRTVAPRALSLLLLLACILLLNSQHVDAGVNLKNGNYYITYTDVILPGRHELKIVRTYNSRSPAVGLFGLGWGSDYETRLDVQGDGTVVAQENGSGARTVFRPPVLSRDEIQAAVDAIMQAADQDNAFRDDSERREKRNELLQDAEARAGSWSRYVKKGLLPARHIPPGTVYRSSTRGQQRLLRTHDGFQRSNGSFTEIFDPAGRLTQTSYDDGWSVYLFRDHQGRIARIVNQEGGELRFHLNDNGTVARIDSSDGKGVIYHYDGNNLVRAVDTAGNAYNHRYDSNANMIAIGYDDGSSRVMTYSGTEYGGSQFIRSVTKRNGATTWYEYGTLYDRPDGQAYFTEVIKTRPNGESSTNRYEYWIAYLSDGSAYTQRTRTTVNGRATDTTYDPNGTPIHIQRGAADAKFEYDDRGRLTLKTDEDMVIRLSYDDTVNKIAKVVRHPIGRPDDQHVSVFEYDANGNLTSATNSDGESFKLSYNELAQISRAESPDTAMAFTYNAMGKPVTIVVDGVGTLNVGYDADGEIESVDAGEGGHRMALRITQAFQSLLSLVKPAGVDLNL